MTLCITTELLQVLRLIGERFGVSCHESAHGIQKMVVCGATTSPI